MKFIYIFFIKILFPLAILFIGCVEYHDQPHIKSENEKLELDLSGRWRFSLGDDLRWKEKTFDDSRWDKIFVPSSWENQGFQGYDGYAWYRTSFRITPDITSKDLYLVLGYIDDIDQTFVNGNLIGVSGGFPTDYRTAYNAFRKYYIPKEFLSYDGDNIIALRVYDDQLEGGIIGNKIGIYSYENGLEPDINLSGIWDFKIGDDSFFLTNGKTDSSDLKLMVPAHWDIQGVTDYDGFAWYKKSFIIPKEFDGENMILMLGKIDDIDQTFVNGTLVGSTGKWNFESNFSIEFDKNEEYLVNRVYSVPQKLFKFGAINTIVVRVYDGFKEGGIYEGPIGLITQPNYKKYMDKKKN